MFNVSAIKKEELYRLIVDGRFHPSESGFLGYLNREPGSLPAAMNALQQALSNLSDMTISSELLKQINYYVLFNVKKTNIANMPLSDVFLNKRSVFRNDVAYFSLSDNNISFEGYQQLNRRYQYVNAKILTPSEWQQVSHKSGSISYYQAPSSDCLESLIFFICESYNAAILDAHSDEDKLYAMASHLQYIDQLHPFFDGNIRTCYILLQRMLIQNGFPPSMMHNPNVFDGFKIDTLVSEIKRGMDVTRQLIANPEQGAYDFVTQIIGPLQDNDDIAMYYQAQQTLHDFLSNITNQHDLVSNKIIKNNPLLIQMIKWLKETTFNPSLMDKEPIFLPNTARLTIFHRLCQLQPFFDDSLGLFNNHSSTTLFARDKKIQYLKNIFDGTTTFNQLQHDDELTKLAEHLDFIEQEIAFLDRVFERWFTADNNQKTQSKLSMELSAHYGFDKSTITLSDEACDLSLATLSSYRINRFFLHALSYSPQSWTSAFRQALVTLLTIVQDNPDSLDFINANRYPARLITRLNALVNNEAYEEMPLFIADCEAFLRSIENLADSFRLADSFINQATATFGIKLLIAAETNQYYKAVRELLRVSGNNGALGHDINELLSWCISKKDITIFFRLCKENVSLLADISENSIQMLINQIDLKPLSDEEFAYLFKLAEIKMGFIKALTLYPEESRLKIINERLNQSEPDLSVLYSLLPLLSETNRIVYLTKNILSDDAWLLLIKKNRRDFLTQVEDLIDINGMSTSPFLLKNFSDKIAQLIDVNELMAGSPIQKSNQKSEWYSLLSHVIKTYPTIRYELLNSVSGEARINALLTIIIDDEQRLLWQAEDDDFVTSIQPLINEKPLITSLQAKINEQGETLLSENVKNTPAMKLIKQLAPSLTAQLNAAQIIQTEIDTLKQYHQHIKQYQANKHEHGKLKKMQFLERLHQSMPDNSNDSAKHDLSQWIDTYKGIKDTKRKALAELQAWFFDDNPLGLQPDLITWIKCHRNKDSYVVSGLHQLDLSPEIMELADFKKDLKIWRKVETWLLQYMQLDGMKPDLAQQFTPVFPKKLTDNQCDIMNKWKTQYRAINDNYAVQMMQLDNIKDESFKDINPYAMRPRVIKHRVAESLIIHNEKIKALEELQLALLESSNPNKASDVLDAWIDKNRALMASKTATFTFFNPTSLSFLPVLRAALNHSDADDDETTANRSSSSWQ